MEKKTEATASVDNRSSLESSTSESGFDMAAVSIQSKILPFWREHPRLWFAQFEALVEPLKTGDEQKYRYVLGVLQPPDIQQISDILLRPPTQGKYATLKSRLLSVYEESEAQQLKKLLSGLELGDQKPTQLLRRMRDHGANMVPDDALKVLWMNQLPAHIRAVLSVNTESSLDMLAIMADKMMEHYESPTIAAIGHQPTPAAIPSPQRPSTSTIADVHLIEIVKRLDKLSLEVAELRVSRRSRQRRPYNSRHRSRSRTQSAHRSRSKSATENPNWLCYYHHRFGDRARRCESPCAKRKPAEN